MLRWYPFLRCACSHIICPCDDMAVDNGELVFDAKKRHKLTHSPIPRPASPSSPSRWPTSPLPRHPSPPAPIVLPGSNAESASVVRLVLLRRPCVQERRQQGQSNNSVAGDEQEKDVDSGKERGVEGRARGTSECTRDNKTLPFFAIFVKASVQSLLGSPLGLTTRPPSSNVGMYLVGRCLTLKCVVLVETRYCPTKYILLFGRAIPRHKN